MKVADILSCNEGLFMDFHLASLEFLRKRVLPACSSSEQLIDKQTIIVDLTGIGFTRKADFW